MKEKKEIVILSRSLPMHGLGGMEIVAWDLACEFVRMGHLVRIITTALPDRPKEFKQNGVTVVALEQAPTRRYSISWWLGSRRYFQQNCMQSAGVVLSVSMAALAILSLKNSLPGVKFIMQAHGTSWGEIISKWRTRQLKHICNSFNNFIWIAIDLLAYSKFDVVVAVGDNVHQGLLSWPVRYFLPPGKVTTIHNGVDTSIFYPAITSRTKLRERLGISLNNPVIISANRLHAQKGTAYSLRVFALLRESVPSATYLIAGDGPEKRNLKKLCEELGIQNSVIFLGILGRMQLAEALTAADIFMFLSERVEGLPLNAIEALACGLPVVVSKNLKFCASPYIHFVTSTNIEAVSNEVKELLTRVRSDDREQVLFPNQFNLKYSAEAYLSLF